MEAWNATAKCDEVIHVMPIHQCDFLRSIADCESNDSFVNYLEFIFCTPDERHPGHWPILQLVLLLIVLFFLLGSTAGEFLCPALVNISRIFQMSQSVAGVTLLAFGNGAPDVISTLAGVGQNRSSLVIAELFGGAIYICTVVIGLLFILNDFDVPKTLLRDVAFYGGASFWALAIFKRGSVQLSDSLGFLLLHGIYLFVAVVFPKIVESIRGMAIFRKIPSCEKISFDDGYSSEERFDQFSSEPCTMLSPPVGKFQRRFSSSVSLHRHLENAICTLTNNTEQDMRERIRYRPSRHNSICDANHKLSRCSSRCGRALFFVGSDIDETTSLLQSVSIKARPTQYIYPKLFTEWQELVMRLRPVEIEEWRSMPLIKRIFHITTYPLILPLTLTIPLVDDHHRRSNWNRPLNVFQCIIVPLVILILVKKTQVTLFGSPLWTLALIMGLALGMLVMSNSVDYKPPSYHAAFSFLGFIVSICWIYRLAIEVVSILKALGIYYSLSEEVLGVSLLTWGNYLGDLVTNLSVASQGYPQMALGACLSTSLVALLIGFGSAFSARLLVTEGRPIIVESSQMLDMIYGFLIGSVVVLVAGTAIARFRSSRTLGFCLVAYYLMFLVALVCKEFALLNLNDITDLIKSA